MFLNARLAMPRNCGKRTAVCLSIVGVAAAAGCSSLPVRQGPLAACQQAFADSDARIREAGAVDAGAHRIPGFPYLRVNRFLASYRHDLDGDRAFRAWARRLRALDIRGRRIELNLVFDAETADRKSRRLQDCGDRLLQADLADSERRTQLRQRARVPDAYNDLARTVGLYPLAVPFLKLGIAGYHAETRARFSEEAGQDTTTAPVRAYRHRGVNAPPRDRIAAWLTAARAASPLDIPSVSDQRMAAIARRYAPRWRITTAGRHDRPGAPLRGPGGLDVATDYRRVYWRHGFTRFDGDVLLQIAYVIWFARRPADGSLDPLAGRLDSVVWRVTLDTDGRPLIYDSIHSCGCYHQMFPTPRLQQREAGGFWRETPPVIDGAPQTGPVTVHLESGSHYIRALSETAAADAAGYALTRYAALRRRQPRLFSASGLIPGSERLERFFLWPSGVVSPGAMRQAGQHAIAFVGKRHFDDPYLLSDLFRRR